MPHKNLRALGLRALGKGASQTDQLGRSGPVVVGAVVDPIGLAVGQHTLGIAGVIVMCTKSDVGVLQAGVMSLDNTDNVSSISRIHDLVVRVEIKNEVHV